MDLYSCRNTDFGWYLFIRQVKAGKKLKRTVVTVLQVCLVKLDGTVYLVWSDTSCAYVCSSNSTIFFFNSYWLNISIPFSSCMSHWVGNLISGNLTFSTNFTFSWHLPHLLQYIKRIAFFQILCSRPNIWYYIIHHTDISSVFFIFLFKAKMLEFSHLILIVFFFQNCLLYF